MTDFSADIKSSRPSSCSSEPGVFVFGRSIHRYSTTSKQWHRVAVDTSKTEAFSHAVELDGMVYLFGKELQCFNPADNSVSSLGLVPNPEHELLGAFAYEQRLFAVKTQGKVHAFDARTRCWKPALPKTPWLPEAYAFLLGAFQIAGQAWVLKSRACGELSVVGFSIDLSDPRPIWRYQVVSVSMPQPLAVAFGEQLLLLGDIGSDGDARSALRVNVLDRTVNLLPRLSSELCGGVPVASVDKVLIAGYSGRNHDSSSSAFVSLNPSTGQISQLADLPLPASEMAAVSVCSLGATARQPELQHSALERTVQDLSAQVAALAAEVAQLQVKQLSDCAACFAARPNCSFQCGHVFCFECAARVHQCPTCRQQVLVRTSSSCSPLRRTR